MADPKSMGGVGTGVPVPPMKDTHAPAIPQPPKSSQNTNPGVAVPSAAGAVNTHRVVPHKELDAMFNGNTHPTAPGPVPNKKP